MILEELAKSLKKRDWGAALIEIGIVVFGILIGLQVDGWNEARKDRVAEKEYLVRLHDNIHTLIELQRERIPLRAENLVHFGDAADILIGAVPLSSWNQEHCTALSNSHIYSPLRTAIPVLNEMLATGKVSLIRDVSVRSAISRVQIQNSRGAELIARLDGSSRVLARMYPDAVFDEIVAGDGGEERHTTRSICDLAAIRSNRALMNDIADNYSRYQAYVRLGLTDTHEQFLQLHELLDQRLGMTHPESES